MGVQTTAKIILVPIASIKENPNNPRIIKDEKFHLLVESIQNFPEMMALRPIIVDENNMVLGGNMRLKALKELDVKEVPVIHAKDLSEEQKKEFIIKDNLPFGEWNWDMLANDWDTTKLEEWGMNIPEFESDEIKDESSDYSSRFEIVIECKDETDQEKTYNQLIERGYKCRVLTL